MNWLHRARCSTADPTLFFDPDRSELKAEWTARHAAAKALCADCPVVDACLAAAIEEGDWDGIRGGMTGRERKAWAKQQGIPRHGTTTGYTRDRCRCALCREAARIAKADSVRRLAGVS